MFLAARQHRRRRAAPAHAARPLSAATSRSPSRPTTPAPSASRTRGGIPDIPETREYVARVLRYRLGVPAGGRGCPRRSVADVAPRAGRVAALPNLAEPASASASCRCWSWSLFWPDAGARALAGGLFLVACLTDFFDGWLARRHGITTALGQFLDPLADKLIVAAVLIMLAAVPPEPRVPGVDGGRDRAAASSP